MMHPLLHLSDIRYKHFPQSTLLNDTMNERTNQGVSVGVLLAVNRYSIIVV